MADALPSPELMLAAAQVATRIAIACLLATAAIGKLRRPGDFAGAVAAYRLLPDAAVWPVARALPPLELLLAAGLIAGMPLALIGTAALLAVFGAAMAANLLRGRRDIDCGCDPTARAKPIGWALVLRNLALAALLLAGLVATQPLPWPVLIAAAGVGVIAWLLSHILTLLGSFAPPRAAVRASGAR